ncbi:unnamed protein product [Zymoseptoria tritici ST99CH_1A5]|uniref:Uncharacterized protein n=4 Tax=Zymoseptoria tritici TaxID=1047171 RepID=A0A1X7RZ15_ZYMT9|nr:unnamed protein product [Zymoseptoria tritici ST99CH_3D7]SMR55441.1 unnamed protein product [Zymoseptoria tritici ST99CH_1E4]SMR57818.1 unnamed protein product [Zymoseptoria tritici ST99CH_3D1]SMY26253.1 unnamed protein product [Zymoseptoria tritici ST99CH_1A5]
MPKGLNLKNFGRRKSSQSGLDFPEEEQPAATSSFRVIERPDKKRVTYGAPDRGVSRPFSSPLHALRGKSENDLGLALEASKNSSRQSSVRPLTGARGSGGTVASGSSGYYDSSASARHSSTSTLPSSIDPDRAPEDEELFPPAVRNSTTSMFHTASAPADIPPPPASFASRAARTFSFAKTAKKESKDDVPPVPPPHGFSGSSPGRDRAMTTSSYASTAVPPKAELTLGNDFGDDFSNMFDSLQKQDGPILPPVTQNFHRTDSEPMFPPRALSRAALSPSPKLQARNDELESPYSYDDPLSAGLLSSSSARSSPRIDSPPVGGGIAQAFFGNTNPGYSRVPERLTSPVLLEPRHSYESLVGQDTISGRGKGKEPEYPNRQTQIDEHDRWVRKVSLRDPQGSSISPAPVNRLAPSNGASRARSPGSSTRDSEGGSDSIHTTPRASRGGTRPVGDDTLFESSPAGPPSRAVRPSINLNASANGTPRKITKEEFQALQRKGESSSDESDEEEHVSDDEYDEDDVERARKIATQRRQQQATMSVYRQQMKKVTGGGPTDLPGNRPVNDRGYSAPALHLGGIGGTPPTESMRGQHSGDDDEDVPLGILQAHGFPSANRPPTAAENDRRTSMAGSAIGAGQGNLPPFARRLPADPYFGAGLVQQSTRESLHGPAASVFGMPTGPAPGAMGHPAGLVGVIAGEERARAARRGSPNSAFGNGANGPNMPLPANMAMGQRTMSMGNLAAPSVYTPSGVPPMPMLPMGMPMMPQGMDPASQQMQQFMQMQMQMMQNMMTMQQAQFNGQNPQNFAGSQRPMSIASHGSFNGLHQRSMTMMNPPQGWSGSSGPGQPRPNSVMPQFGNSHAPSVAGLAVPGSQPGQGYTPSIAPSERSNVGRASRYRPVSQFDDLSGRTQSMTSSHTLQAFTRQQSSQNVPGTTFNGTTVQTPKSTIRVIDKAKGAPKTALGGKQVLDEDEDDGWAEMKKKREDKKKSKWTLGRKGKNSAAEEQAALEELYQGIN